MICGTGAGDKAFCVGGDQKQRAESGDYGPSETGLFEVETLHRVIRDVPKPVIAAVNGFAIGGGHVLHVLCDLTIAADTAVFGQTGRGSGPSMQASAPATSRGSSARSVPARSGSCAASTPPSKQPSGAWSTRSCRPLSSRPRCGRGLTRSCSSHRVVEHDQASVNADPDSSIGRPDGVRR